MERLNFLVSLVVAFCLPLGKSIMLFSISLWVLTWLLEGNFMKKAKLNFVNKKTLLLLLSPVLLYLFHSIGYFYSDNKVESLFDLEVKLSLLIFPIIFLTANSLYKKYGKALLIAFVLGNVVASIICLGMAFINSTVIVDGKIIFETAIYKMHVDKSFFWLIGERLSLFSYAKLSVILHPSYFSMYLVFGVAISYYLYRTSVTNLYKGLYFLTMLLFSVMVYLLSTRSGLIGLSATIISLLIIEFTNSKYYALIFFITFSLLAIKVIPASKLKNNFVELYNKTKSESNNVESDVRLVIWKNAILIIKENVIWGTGNGDVNDEILKKYKEQKYTRGIEHVYNTHNQYLQTMLSGGIIAILILFFMLISTFVYSLKNKRIVLSFLACLIIFNFLFESMLNRISGVIFFAFFFSLLIIYAPPRIKGITDNSE